MYHKQHKEQLQKKGDAFLLHRLVELTDTENFPPTHFKINVRLKIDKVN